VTATLIGIGVLRQIPTILEILGIALVVVALLLSARGSTAEQPETPP
jgi:inner membrane transporter RhtA